MKESFVVKGQPRPWMAPKYSPKGTYSDAEMKQYQVSVAHQVWHQMATRKILGTWPTNAKRYKMSIKVYFKTKRFADITNIRKNVEDALQGILYDNDRNLDHGPGERYCDPENPRVELEITVEER